MKFRLGMMMLLTTAVVGCNQGEKKKEQVTSNDPQPIHSFARPAEAVVNHLDLKVAVDFDQQKLAGTATYQIEVTEGSNRIIFDTRALKIQEVQVDGKATSEWWLGPEEEFLGVPLEIAVTDTNSSVSIVYETTSGAEALQWLSPQQTAGKKHPFLFTQSQAILARTWLPCQDSPGIRYTYSATVQVPSELMALMSATNPTQLDSTGIYHFEMKQPIPSYLMALSVGDLQFLPIGAKTGVYAEPSVVEAVAYEFADMQKMLETAESLYGPYAWDRYDVIVLPPSFPFGGMENPRLTFATPTILAGDRSLTSLVAHELAHSWSGNLVTNSTWNDFWINEGFTVYFERRIMEEIYGKDYANMLAILGWQDLQSTLESLSDQPEDTRLKLSLEGRNPDDGMTDIAYEKGYFFLRTLEENLGREKFDAFLKQHFQGNAFETMHTEEFLKNMKTQLLDGNEELYDELKVKEWVYEAGIPSNVVEVSSSLFAQVEDQVQVFMETGVAAELDTANWTTHQWLHFLRKLPNEMDEEKLAALDNAYGFTNTGNSEIASAWFQLAIANDYEPAYPAIEAFLLEVGRRKFLAPIYKALVSTEAGMERAKEIYSRARGNYHSVSVNTLDALMGINQ